MNTRVERSRKSCEIARQQGPLPEQQLSPEEKGSHEGKNWQQEL